MSELSVGTISGLAANSYVVDIASGSSLDLSNATDLPASALPTGSILQVVSTTKTDTFSSSLAAGADTAITGLSVSITPTSASSKIFILGSVSSSATVVGASVILKRDSTEISVGNAAGSREQVTTGSTPPDFAAAMTSAGVVFLDSPATTSAVTYSFNISNQRGSTDTVFVNRTKLDSDASGYGRATSTITVMEVAG